MRLVANPFLVDKSEVEVLLPRLEGDDARKIDRWGSGFVLLSQRVT